MSCYASLTWRTATQLWTCQACGKFIQPGARYLNVDLGPRGTELRVHGDALADHPDPNPHDRDRGPAMD